VGIRLLRRAGDLVHAGDEVLELHYRDPSRLETAQALAARALVIGDSPVPARPLIVREVR